MNHFNSFLILFSILFSIQTYSQSSEFDPKKDSKNIEAKLNPDFFLLGTFSDYMGRFQYIDREKQIDRYYPYEEPVINYLTSFIKTNYDIIADTTFSRSRHSEMYAETLAQKLHSYYDESGNFKTGIFDTEEKKYSFLTGVYYRYGQNLKDNIYEIRVVNSPKGKEIYRILKELECDRMIYKFLRGYVPSSDIFYFEATHGMIKYFNTIKQEKDKQIPRYLSDLRLLESIKLIFDN